MILAVRILIVLAVTASGLTWVIRTTAARPVADKTPQHAGVYFSPLHATYHARLDCPAVQYYDQICRDSLEAAIAADKRPCPDCQQTNAAAAIASPALAHSPLPPIPE